MVWENFIVKFYVHKGFCFEDLMFHPLCNIEI